MFQNQQAIRFYIYEKISYNIAMEKELGVYLEEIRYLAVGSQMESFATKEGILLALDGVCQDSADELLKLAEVDNNIDSKLKKRLVGHHTRIIAACSIVENELESK